MSDIGYSLGAARAMTPPVPMGKGFGGRQQNVAQFGSNQVAQPLGGAVAASYDATAEDDYDEFAADSYDVPAVEKKFDETFLLPEKVITFIGRFYDAMANNRIAEVRYYYYKEWTTLTKMYFSDVEWPTVNEVAPLCEENEVFLLCYKELYFRHIFVHGKPGLQHRFQSWENYCALFETFLAGAATSNLRLPLEWLNDMVDEFLYHFQDFCTFRTKLKDLPQEDIDTLAAHPNVWNVQTVLGYLTSFVERSGIKRLLSSDKAQVSGAAATRLPVLQGLGYFSLVGLCRLHCLLADYHFSVKVLDPIDIDDKRGLFTRVTASHITIFYYLGFSYFMMRRYADAIDVWSMILVAHRTSKDRTSSFADDQIMNKYDKILGLTALAYSLCPGHHIDETVRQLVMEKYGDSLQKMSNRDEGTFESTFNYACPRFINPSTPNFSERVNRHQEAYQKQFKWLISEVRQHYALPEIRSFLKLYKSIHISKLAGFCRMKEEDFREALMSIKYQARQLYHEQDTSPIKGERTSINDIHFHVVGDMVFIDESRRPQPYAQYFIDHSLKFQQAIDDMNENKPAGPIRVLGDQDR